MKYTTNIIMPLLLCTLLLLSGCAGSPINIKSTNSDDVVVSKGRSINAEACGFQLLLFIPININTRLERAWASLQGQAGNDVIANVGITESWTYGFVGTSHCTTLSATAYPRSGK